MTDLIAQATTNAVKPAHHLCIFLPGTCPCFCYLSFPPRYTEVKKEIRIFFVTEYKPNGKDTIFPSPTRLHVSHSLISSTSIFSPSQKVGKILLLFKFLGLLELNKVNFGSEHVWQDEYYCSFSIKQKKLLRTVI